MWPYNIRISESFFKRLPTRRSRGCGCWGGFFTQVSTLSSNSVVRGDLLGFSGIKCEIIMEISVISPLVFFRAWFKLLAVGAPGVTDVRKRTSYDQVKQAFDYIKIWLSNVYFGLINVKIAFESNGAVVWTWSNDAFRKEPDLELEGLLKRHYTTVEFFQGTMMNAVDLERVKVRVRQIAQAIRQHGHNYSLKRV